MHEDLIKILARRSIRAYRTGEPISDNDLRDMLKVAMSAPSAGGRDPWDFIIVKSPATLIRAADALPNGSFLAQANAGILVCGTKSQAHRSDMSYLLLDCGAAIENLLLAATFLGIGSCWLAVYPNEERIAALRTIFMLPKPVIPIAMIALGTPQSPPKARTRFSDFKVHQEVW